MGKTNLTIQLDTELIRRVKVLAAERGTSVSALMARQVAELVAQAERYEEAHRRALESMAGATSGGGRNWTRDDIYAERLDRHGR